MRLEYNLELRQTQKLLMTPQLRQAITLLQLPVLELSEYLDQQYLENPMLELDDGVDAQEIEPAEEEKAFDIDWEQYFQDRGDVGEPINREANKKGTFEQFTASATTLQQRLSIQLSMLTLPRGVARIANYIINNLDDNGYLTQPCTEIAAQLHVTEPEVLGALGVVQNLEPAGIGARDLRECLLLQLKDRDNVPPYTWQIVCQYLDLVAKGRIPVLAEKFNVENSEIQKAVDYIRGLEPKPGQSLGEETKPAYIFPDITVMDVNGEWIIMVNDSYPFRLRVSPIYHRLLQAAETEEIKKFLQEKFNSALWLMKSLEQRRSTLHRIAEFILEYQQPFFKQGVKYLRPLRLKDVAEVLDVHESTVSRAVNGKYIQTPRGLFELKYFFSVNLETEDGGGASSTGVKKILEELVAGEDSRHPLTDQQLSQCLQERGVKISRRTVAKYREELNIPSSTLRKRWA
jgi:RNA polymerase sigma-54 factor